MTTWQDLEDEVRSIAELKWDVSCNPEDVGGVRIDGVCKVADDEWVLIEISKSGTLEKLRTDIAKLVTAKAALWSQNVFARCIFVTSSNEHPSVRASAQASRIQYFTLTEFEAQFLGGHRYIRERSHRPFGSAVELESGKIDSAPYVPTSYVDADDHPWSIGDIARGIRDREKFILLGEFGSGKSRCVMELFGHLSGQDGHPAPLAIDLRDAWGKKTLNSVIREHLETLGLSDIADATIKSLARGYNPLLLDGFDELSSQSWSPSSEKMVATRWVATQGARHLVQSSPDCGLIVTGRPHFFSSDEEMLRCLGMDSGEVRILYCADQFTQKQARAYLDAIDEAIPLPEWIPRKPLICQLIASLPAEEMEAIATTANGETEFFELSLDAICRRETRTSPLLDADALKQLLVRLALTTRREGDSGERLSPEDVSVQFHAITAQYPGEESAVLLQKIPYLARTGTGSPDRVFIDEYVREGLSGLGLHWISAHTSSQQTDRQWARPLTGFGLQMWAVRMHFTQALSFARQEVAHERNQTACDFLAASLHTDHQELDFDGFSLPGGGIGELALTDTHLKNLTVSNVIIEDLTVDGFEFTDVYFGDCLIARVHGVSSRADMPECFAATTEILEFDSSMTTSSIGQLNLSDEQRTLLSIVQKLFFQKGAGRKESALLRGTAKYWHPEAAGRVLGLMVARGIVSVRPGREGRLYIPNRQYMTRMRSLRAEQKSSTDELWLVASSE